MIKIKFKPIIMKNIQILCNKSPIIPLIPDFAKHKPEIFHCLLQYIGINTSSNPTNRIQGQILYPSEKLTDKAAQTAAANPKTAVQLRHYQQLPVLSQIKNISAAYPSYGNQTVLF